MSRPPPTTACIIASSTAAVTVTGKGCGDAVEHHVDAAAAQLGEPVVGDRGADQGLAGEVLQAEADQLVVGRDDDVGVAGCATGQGVADRVPGAWICAFTTPGEQARRPERDGRGQPEQRVGGDLGRQVERSSGSAKSMLSVYSRSRRVVRSWFSPPSTTVRALAR